MNYKWKEFFYNFSDSFKSILKFGIIMVSITFGFIFFGTLYGWSLHKKSITENLDKYEAELSRYDESITKPVKIFDKNENLIGEFFRANYRPIRKDNLREHAIVIWAILSSEDREFFRHSGVNIRGLLRAIWINIKSRRVVQGGSTVTQQLAKLTMNLGERSIFNKLVELFCTFYIENRYDKETILAMYLNQIFLGEGNTGVEEASRYYFNKSASSLTYAEAAMIAGIIPAPSVYNPVRSMETALKRQRMILNLMKENKHLHLQPSKIEKDFDRKLEAYIDKFKKTYAIKEVSSKEGKKQYTSQISRHGVDKNFRVNKAPEFNEKIRNVVLSIPELDLENTSLTIHTTLDLKKQQIAETALREGVEAIKIKLEKRRTDYLEKGNKQEAEREKNIIDSMNGSLISINPFTGFIEAYVGSYKFSSIYKLDRVEEIQRQPGSTIKALIYALALEKRIITPSTIVVDEKINIGGYSPKNWYSGYKGQMTARQALAQSVNTVAVKLLHEMGVNYFLRKLAEILGVEYADLKNRMGNNLSLALGSAELSPYELALIYTTIANNGKKVYPKFITKIEDNRGNLYFDYRNVSEEEIQILDPVACAMVINMMEAVLTREGTLDLKKPGKEDFPMAGKTGTVQIPPQVRQKWANRKGVRDSWFAGMVPALTTVVWIGSDLGAPFPGSGSENSGQVWWKYASSIYRNYGFEESLIRPFEGDFVRVDICGETGELLQTSSDCQYPLLKQYYYRGDEPKEIIPNFEAPTDFIPAPEEETDSNWDLGKEDKYEYEAPPTIEEEQENSSESVPYE